MIIDTFERLKFYTPLNKHFSTVIDFCRTHDYQSIPEGRFDIDRDTVYGIAMTCDMRSVENAQCETHKKHIDIQLVLGNEETMGYASLQKLSQSEGYNAENDCEFWKDPCTSFSQIPQDHMAIFFPEDAHMPLLGKGVSKKIVFKIRVPE